MYACLAVMCLFSFYFPAVENTNVCVSVYAVVDEFHVPTNTFMLNLKRTCRDVCPLFVIHLHWEEVLPRFVTMYVEFMSIVVAKQFSLIHGWSSECFPPQRKRKYLISFILDAYIWIWKNIKQCCDWMWWWRHHHLKFTIWIRIANVFYQFVLNTHTHTHTEIIGLQSHSFTHTVLRLSPFSNWTHVFL